MKAKKGDIIGQENITLTSFAIAENEEAAGKGGDIFLKAKGEIKDLEILTLSSIAQSGSVLIQGSNDLSISNLDVITSKQIIVENPIGGGTITLPVGESGQSGKFTITSKGSLILRETNVLSDTNGTDKAGDVEIRSQKGTIALENTRIDSKTTGGGLAGNIIFNSPQSITISGTDSSVLAETQSIGNAGNITFDSPLLSLGQGVTVSATTAGEGDSGTVNVIAPMAVNLGANAQLTVETSGSGKAGNINIDTNTLNIGKDAQLSATAQAASNSSEGGGSINLNASNLNISGELGVFAETQSNSPAGNLTVNPFGKDPNLRVRFSDNGFISASTSAVGIGGNIDISAPQTIDIRGDGTIEVATSGNGNAGSIMLASENLTLAEGVEISASSIGSGNAGIISLDATQLTFLKGKINATNISEGKINAITNNAGNAGSILFSYRGNNAEQVNLNNATISTVIQSQGNATQPSNIELKTNNLTLANSSISASTQGRGDAGSINIPKANTITLIETINQSNITASTSGIGDTGLISLNATQSIKLDNNSQINSAVQENGQGNSQKSPLILLD